MLTGYMISLLILFGNFYIQSYIIKKPAPKKLESEELQNGAAVKNGAVLANGHRGSGDADVKRRH